MAQPLRMSNNKKRKLQQLVAQATQAYRAQRFDMCENLCKHIEAMHPEDADVAAMRGGMCLALYSADEALPFFVAAAQVAPKRIEFQLNLGRLYLQSHQYDLAIAAYSNAVHIQPDEMLALLGCCRSLIGLGRFSEAEDYLLRAQVRALRLPDEYIQMSVACADLNHSRKAFSLLDELLDHFPDHVHGYFQKAVALLQAGEKEEAKIAIDKTLELQPFHARALSVMADLWKFTSSDDPKIEMIQDAVEHGQPNMEDQILLDVAMGRVMHKLGEYDDAFGYFHHANEGRAQATAYDLNTELEYLKGIARCFTPTVFAQAASLQDATPLFIVGMPRCGSTLTEQILAAHPQVSGRGEIDLFEPVLFSLLESEGPQTLEEMASFPPNQWTQVGSLYLERLRSVGPVTHRITDKSLNNIRMLGAIHCALPQAKIVHVRRHPLDTCLSIYTSNIQGGAYDYGLRLETLGKYYRQYKELMQHWREVLPQSIFYELDYEQLVSDPEAQTRRLLEFCDLEWDERCLQFERTEQRVKTASLMQVRQAINTQSVERWRCYEKHLQPLIRILDTD